MKQLALITTILFLFSGCKQATDTGSAEQDELAKQNIELVKKMMAAFENEDIETLMDIYSPDAISEGPMLKHEFPYDSIMAGNAEWFASSDSIKWDVNHIMATKVEEGDLAGDWVLLWAHVSWYDLESGKTLEVRYHSPLQIEDGKIVFEVGYWNQWDVFSQLGAELKWPEKE